MSNFAVYESCFGKIGMEYDDGCITFLKRVDDTSQQGTKTALTDMVYNQLTQYFMGDRKTFDFPYKLNGTDFQMKVWKVLCDIPYGETRSYKDIASAVGNTKACRAVGMANNKNPITIAVPCHRVLGASGKLTGYAGGLEMKAALLEMEKKKMNTIYYDFPQMKV